MERNRSRVINARVKLKCRRRMVTHCTHPVRWCFSSTFSSHQPPFMFLFCWYNLLPSADKLTHIPLCDSLPLVCVCVCLHANLHVCLSYCVSLCECVCILVPSSVCLSLPAFPLPKKKNCAMSLRPQQEPIIRLLFRGKSVTEHKWLVKCLTYSLTLCLSAFTVFHWFWKALVAQVTFLH